MEKIDLRSDTVTHPTAKMREVMATAPVGDDVYGEDPTINYLQEMAADMLGKEAGLFVSSGTQGNIVSIFAHCGRGEEMIVAQDSHIFLSEGGNPATLGGVSAYTLPVQSDGTIPIEQIEAAIRAENDHYPRTRLVSLENTHANTGGQILSVDYVDAVGELCHQHGLKLHIDGARIFNAATALHEDVARIVQVADSITFCLSKGLCAPVGSIVVGDVDFIYETKRIRKTMGGGMRQAGILAAAGIVALEEMTQRLDEDHQTACQLAEGFATIPNIEVDPTQTVTNFVIWKLKPSASLTPAELIAKLGEDGIVARMPSRGMWRFVTHYWIKPDHIDYIIERMRMHLS